MSTATAGLTATCDRIRSLAADLGIELRIIESAHPAHRDAILVEVRTDDADAFEEVLWEAPEELEFGCSWHRSDRLGWAGLFLPPPAYVTRTVPRADLPQLLTCFQSATGNILAKGRQDPSRRRFEWIAIFAAALVAGVVTASTGHYNLAYITVLIAASGTFGAEDAESELAVLDRLTSGRVPG